MGGVVRGDDDFRASLLAFRPLRLSLICYLEMQALLSILREYICSFSPLRL